MKRMAAVLGIVIICLTALALPASAEEGDTKENPMVVMKTNKGDIVIELYPDKAPITVENFLQYVDDGTFNGTIFHRVIRGFMIQGGGYDAEFTKKPTRAPIENEAKNGLSNEPGTIAMARTSDPNSATAQFFINTVNNGPTLDAGGRAGPHGYAVFGKVTEGYDVVKKIEAVPTGARGPFRQDVPQETVLIESVTRKK
jgi:peptidyl-prolyl cis-trans isomerase A (cyclophilin A)